MKFINQFLNETKQIVDQLDHAAIESVVNLLAKVRNGGGRLFFLGIGGSASNASHAVNDFRKIAGIEAYAPTDNVAELTARTNDDGWATIFVAWLKTSNLSNKDAVMVLSVGGGNLEKNISVNIVEALKYAKSIQAKILGIVSRDGGYTKQVADGCIMVPVIKNEFITPFAESLQALIWHLIVFSPEIRNIEP